jgi:hypothetical protein
MNACNSLRRTNCLIIETGVVYSGPVGGVVLIRKPLNTLYRDRTPFNYLPPPPPPPL